MAHSDGKSPTLREVKTRRCLLCGAEFESEWAGERICTRCRSSAAWKQG